MKNIVFVAIAILFVVGVTYKITTQHGQNKTEVSKTETPGTAPGQAGTTQQPEGSNPTGVNGVAQTGAGVNGSTGTTGVTGAKTEAGKAPGSANELSAVKVEHNCFSFEYRHKKEAMNRDIEDFLDLSNAFPILHKNWNQKTMCVKVNQKAMAYKVIKNKGQEEVLLGSVVGPESVIRVSYCTGKAACKESCNPPKKRFMDDMEEEANADDSFQDSWGASDEKSKKELKAKAKELRSVASENENLDSRSIERDWDTLNQNEWTCKEK